MNRLFVGFLIIGIVLGFVLVVAQEGEEEILDLGNLLGIGGNITASGIDYSIEETEQRKDTTISFTKEDSFLDIGGNTFENIQPGSDELDAFVKLDESGEIIEADFMTNENGGTYNFLGEDIFVPANSRVLFDQEGGLIVEAAEGAEFKEEDNLFDLKLIGENIKLPNGKILNAGELEYDSLGYAHLSSGNTAIVDNVALSANKDLDVYFDGERHSGNYVSFGDEFYLGGSDSAEVVFEGKNNYFKNMGDNDLVRFGLGEEESEIRVVPNNFKGYSDVYCENKYSVETGELKFVSNGEQVYILDGEFGESSVKTDLHTSVGKYNKIISIKDDSNYQAHLLEGNSLTPSVYDFYNTGEGSELTGNVLSGDFWKEYSSASKYIREANEKYLQAKFSRKYPELDISIFKNAKDNSELDEIASRYSIYYVLTVNEVESELRGTPYENYFEKKEVFETFQAVSFPTSGTKEALGKGAVGIRTLFLKIA